MWPHPGDIIGNGTSVAKTEGNRRTITLRGKGFFFWCEIQCLLLPLRMGYYFEKDTRRCMEALEANGSSQSRAPLGNESLAEGETN